MGQETGVKGITMITKEELGRRMESGELIQIVNVLSPEHYHLGFIKGSLKIPLDSIEARSGELDTARDVITYCASNECNASKHAAEKLAQKGFDVRAYEGGIREWREADLPMEA